MKQIRTLSPSDIELRVADKNKKGDVHMLLYITSRSATNLLDETYGPENYNIEYVDVAGQIYCKLSIWDEEHNRYIVRMDTGEEAKIAADKSLASDALKRTIVRMGVVELYSGPSVYIPDDGYGNTGYKVSEIAYDENRNITHLVIVNRFDKEAFRWDKGQTAKYPTKTAPNTPPSNQTVEQTIEEMKSYCRAKYKEYTESDRPMDAERVKEFVSYYENKLKSGEWKGQFNVERLLENWINKKR